MKALTSASSGTTVAALRHDGLQAASAQGVTVRLWNLPDGKPLATLAAGRDHILSLVYSSDGQWLFAGSDSADERSTLWCWKLDELTSPPRVWPAHYRTTALAATAGLLLSGGGEDDGSWTLWSLPGLEPRQHQEGPGAVVALAIDDQGWAVLRDQQLEVWGPEGLLWSSPVDGLDVTFSLDANQVVVALAAGFKLFPRAGGRGRELKGTVMRTNLKPTTRVDGEGWFGPCFRRAGNHAVSWHQGALAGHCGKRLLWQLEPPQPLTSLVVTPALVAGVRGSRVVAWNHQGKELWSHQLAHPVGRLLADPFGRWLGALGEEFAFFRVSDGHLVSFGSENVGGTLGGESVFGRLTFYPDFVPWKTDAQDLWSPVMWSDKEWNYLWDGRSYRLRDGQPGPVCRGFHGQAHQITFGEGWMALSNDTWIGIYERDGHLRSLTEAWGAANSGVAYNLTATRALRVRFDQLQLWDLTRSTLLEERPGPETLTCVAGHGPYYLGGWSGTLYQTDA